MVTLTNRSRFVVKVQNREDLTRHVPFTERDAVRSYLQELRARLLKPKGDQLDEHWLVRIRQRVHKTMQATFRSKAEAEDFIEQLSAERKRGLFVDYTVSPKVTVADLVVRYLREEAPRHKICSILGYFFEGLLADTAGLRGTACSMPIARNGRAADCSPARERAAEQRRIEECRGRDRGWRVEEATRLVREAAELSGDDAVPATKVVALQGALASIQTDGAVSQATTADSVEDDPPRAALTAVQVAAQAVAAGRYGKAPAEQVRSTRTYRLWADLWAAVEGETEGSLLRALQIRGFVKRRGR